MLPSIQKLWELSVKNILRRQRRKILIFVTNFSYTTKTQMFKMLQNILHSVPNNQKNLKKCAENKKPKALAVGGGCGGGLEGSEGGISMITDHICPCKNILTFLLWHELGI